MFIDYVFINKSYELVNYKCPTYQAEEGSALITVLIISVIITILMGGIFGGIQLQRSFIQQDIHAQEALYKAEAGIYEYLATSPNLNRAPLSSFPFALRDSSEVQLRARVYGGFYHIRSTAFVHGKSRSIEVLVGQKAPDVFKYAVAIGDSTSSLKVTGKTKIRGDIRAGRQGMQEDSFKGFPFSGTIDGKVDIETSESLLPSFNLSSLNTQFDRIEKEFNDPLYRYTRMDSVQVLRWMQNGAENVLRTSGNLYVINKEEKEQPNRPLTLIVEGNLTLNGSFKFEPYTRIIVSDTLLMGGSVEGKHLFVYAGKSLQVGGAMQASGQFLSRGPIRIRDNAYLEYPSLVYTEKEFGERENSNVIRIMGQATIDGSIVYPIRARGINQASLKVKLDAGAKVRGGIFSLGQTELQGEVLGSVLTNQFYFYESPSAYINWLKDANIDITQRPAQYVVPIGFGAPKEIQYQVLDWKDVTPRERNSL